MLRWFGKKLCYHELQHEHINLNTTCGSRFISIWPDPVLCIFEGADRHTLHTFLSPPSGGGQSPPYCTRRTRPRRRCLCRPSPWGQCGGPWESPPVWPSEFPVVTWLTIPHLIQLISFRSLQTMAKTIKRRGQEEKEVECPGPGKTLSHSVAECCVWVLRVLLSPLSSLLTVVSRRSCSQE